jgi:lipoprotein NlpD
MGMGSEPAPVAVARPVQSSTVMGTPVAPNQAKSNAPAATAAAAPASGASAATAAAAPVAAPTGDDEQNWIWPASGSVIAGFDEAKNKGLDIGGNAGDPVLAAADGRVVYAGEGLRGYGKLIILKHNNVYLTAYAHNRALLVKEDATVKRGQKIAEMGDTDADRVKLHFEVRKQGKPVDPAKYMPSR